MEPDQTSPENPVIDYATPSDEVRALPLLRFARWVGWIPLYVGVGSLIFWLVTRAYFFIVVGLWTVLLGTITTGIGIVCLIIYYFLNRQSDIERKRKVSSEVSTTIALYVLDYLAAFLCFVVALRFGAAH